MSIGRVVMAYNNFDALAAKMPKAVGRIVWKNGNRIRNFILDDFASPKHGRLYRKSAITKSYKAGGRGVRKWEGSGAKMRTEGGKTTVTVGYNTHRSSAPGESPAIDYGVLKGSVSVEMTGPATAVLGVGAEYAVPLEYGTRKMAARPFVRPNVDRVEPAFMADMGNLEAELK